MNNNLNQFCDHNMVCTFIDNSIIVTHCEKCGKIGDYKQPEIHAVRIYSPVPVPVEDFQKYDTKTYSASLEDILDNPIMDAITDGLNKALRLYIGDDKNDNK